MFEARIVTLNLHRYFMIILCLISPDFGTCSLTLHKYELGDLVKRLSTFAILALSILAPMFLFFLHGCEWTVVDHRLEAHKTLILSFSIELS